MDRQGRRSWRDVGVLTLLAFTLSGAPAGFSRPSTPGAGQAPTFRVGTTLVEVDAIVRDPSGRFVPGLTVEDFEVFESGRPQKIETFYLVDGSLVRSAQAASPRDPAPSSPTTRALSQTPERIFLLWFDPPHMSPGSLVRAKRAGIQFVQTSLASGDVAGVLANGTVIGRRLTSSQQELVAAVESIQISGESTSAALDMREWPRFASLYEAARVDVGDEKVLSRITARACADDPDRCGGVGGEDAVRLLVLAKGRAMTRDARTSARRTLSGLEALTARLASLPGRKTIIFLSDGFFSEDLFAPMQAVVGRAARAAVRIYALDTRGLNRGSAGSQIVDAPPQERIVSSPDVPGELPQFDIAADGPNSLAVDTGGLMFRNENDFGKVLREVAEDTSRYYVLGYRPDPGALEGTFRPLQVRVKGSGLTVRARKGYFASSTAVTQPASDAVWTPLEAPPAAPEAARPTLEANAVAPTSLVVLSESPSRPDGTPLPADPGSVRLRPGPEAARADATFLREVTANAPTSGPLPPALLAQALDGWAAYERGDTKAARVALATAAAHSSAPVWVNYVMGWSAFAEGDLPTARQQWERVKATVPEFEPVYLNLADTYLREQERPDALVILTEAANRWPDHPELQNALGVVYSSMGRLKEAIPAFVRATVAAPDDATGHFNLGRASEIAFVAGIMGDAAADQAALIALRDRAASGYRRVTQLGGALAGGARAGLRRLSPLDASRLQVSGPAEVLRSNEDKLGGTPARLVWSPDGSRLCLRSVRVDERGAVTSDSLRLISLDGRVEAVKDVPVWAASYWSWKSAVAAPWRPEVRLSVQERSVSVLPQNLNPFSAHTTRDYSRQPRKTTVMTYSVHGEDIGAEIDALITRGATFSWSPFAMGALVYVDRRSALVILDTSGRKRDVPGSRNARLPAWSPDGTKIAFFIQNLGLRLVVVDVQPAV